ncbi:MAG: methyltransferase domain-containing protein [Bacteroidetes bacterium]|nr:methyltransferase domain-containing protein [Bacteroidota bacterium]
MITEHSMKQGLHILEIGTGSGCIPISLYLNLDSAHITAVDISSAAIDVAQRNADRLGAAIEFSVFDFLDESRWHELGQYDIIVSNPPYIPRARANEMQSRVKSYEPDLALFVEDEDPFLFYKKTLSFAQSHLKSGGVVYFETSQYEQLEVFEPFVLTSKKDMSGNVRFLKAGF